MVSHAFYAGAVGFLRGCTGIRLLFDSPKFNKGLAEIASKPLDLPGSFTVTAHAGAIATVSNSVQSVGEAIIAGVDVVEVDLNFRPDGTPVAVHNVPKTNRDGVPFSDILRVIAKSETIAVNLDLKSTLNLKVIQGMIEEYDGLPARVFFTGITDKYIDAVRQHCPRIPYYLNFSPYPEFKNTPAQIQGIVESVKSAGAIGINLDKKYFAKELCAAMHESGLLVSVWTVDKTIEQYRILAAGPDNITTKQPLKLMKIIEGWTKKV